MYLFLAAFSTPLVLSVHSVVSFDFAMALTPGWHTTIFPPYFVAGAIFSGFAMVWTIAIPMRKWFKLEHYITLNHLDATAKMVLFTSMVVGCAYLIEFFIAWYGGVRPEQEYFWNRVFGQWWWAAWIMLTLQHDRCRCRCSRRSCAATPRGCSSCRSSSTSACGSSAS
jgi:Ni/Fe-hydrogenase subunit HybB-like protein